jgi:hypothetical protein
MATSEGSVKLLDFRAGEALADSDEIVTTDGMVMGTADEPVDSRRLRHPPQRAERHRQRETMD